MEMVIDLVAKIITMVVIFISIYWIGYIIGQQKLLKDLLKHEYTRITKNE